MDVGPVYRGGGGKVDPGREKVETGTRVQRSNKGHDLYVTSETRQSHDR